MKYPFRVVFSYIEEAPQAFPAQVLISIPKRKIRKAVNRNLLKRRTREAYRKEKHKLYDSLKNTDKLLTLGLIYVATDIISYTEIAMAVDEIIKELKKRL